MQTCFYFYFMLKNGQGSPLVEMLIYFLLLAVQTTTILYLNYDIIIQIFYACIFMLQKWSGVALIFDILIDYLELGAPKIAVQYLNFDILVQIFLCLYFHASKQPVVATFLTCSQIFLFLIGTSKMARGLLLYCILINFLLIVAPKTTICHLNVYNPMYIFYLLYFNTKNNQGPPP